jgi:superfamily II DNA or RNA helicase
MQSVGYIYTRFHESYEKYNACKLGETNNIPNRDSGYATGEIKRGYFDNVYEVPYESRKDIETILQNEFKQWHIKIDGGKEFFNIKIISLIEPCLVKYKIEYKKLTSKEIRQLIRCYRIQKIMKKKNIKSLINFLKISKKVVPRHDQTIIIKKTVAYFQQYNKGILVLMCGVGKTLISLWVSQKMGTNTILIGVPNKLLLKQWEQEVGKIFQKKNFQCLVVSGGVNVSDIAHFLENNKERCIVITTYASSHKVLDASMRVSFVFNMKILDEVHHLTSNNINEEERKTYIQILKIDSAKQIALTATLKILENKENMRDDDIIVSNDNNEYFGEIIDRKCLLWAINKEVICDYVIQTIMTNEEQLERELLQFNVVEENDKRLFLSAFTSLKSIHDGHSHHLLIYANNKDNSSKLVQYVTSLLKNNYFDIPELFSSNYHSEMNPREQSKILTDFKNAKFGIISCVYCLGEGWDFPLLDAVVFAENMSSIIRIVQSALRASRKNKFQPNKITKIILPILNRDDWLENNENSDLKKVKEVIHQIGLEDETVAQKIKVFKITIEKHPPKPKMPKHESIIEFGEYDDEFTQKIRLKTVKRIVYGISYEKAKKIIASKKIKSKESYFELCENDNRLSKEPEILYKGQFVNWIDYLSIERIYYDLETCKSKANTHISIHNELKQYYLDLSMLVNELCKIDMLFPPNGLWVEYYGVKDVRDIINLTNKKKKMGAIL